MVSPNLEMTRGKLDLTSVAAGWFLRSETRPSTCVISTTRGILKILNVVVNRRFLNVNFSADSGDNE